MARQRSRCRQISLLLLLVALWLFGRAQAQGAQTIHLTVDYDDGVQKQFVLAFKVGMTVFDALAEASSNPHGLSFDCDPKFPCNGPAANRLLRNIDDVKNQGGGISGKNWHFWVNGIYANKGFGVCGIKPQDNILWKFGCYHGDRPGNACR